MKLNPNGQCLGVALSEIGTIFDVSTNRVSLDTAYSVSDAIHAIHVMGLSCRVIVRPRASFIERAMLRMTSAWRKIDVQSFDSALSMRSVFLCLRSVKQLYNAPSFHAHWVVLHCENSRLLIIDHLHHEASKTYNIEEFASPDVLIHQLGVSLAVRRRK